MLRASRTDSVEEVVNLLPKMANEIMKADLRHPRKLALSPPAILKIKRRKKSNGGAEKRENAIYRAVKAGAVEPTKCIPKGLPRRASELPVRITDRPQE